MKELYDLATADCPKVSKFFESKPLQLNATGGSSSFVEPSAPLISNPEDVPQSLAASCDLEDDKSYPQTIALDVETVPVEIVLEPQTETKGEDKDGESSGKRRVPRRKSHSRRLDNLVDKKLAQQD